MPETIDPRPQKRSQAIRSALFTAFWLLLSAALLLTVRAYCVPEGIGSVVLAAAAGLETLMLLPLAFTLKERLKEIEGGEEDEARKY